MEQLPTELQKIIMDYKYKMEEYENRKRLLQQLDDTYYYSCIEIYDMEGNLFIHQGIREDKREGRPNFIYQLQCCNHGYNFLECTHITFIEEDQKLYEEHFSRDINHETKKYDSKLLFEEYVLSIPEIDFSEPEIDDEIDIIE